MGKNKVTGAPEKSIEKTYLQYLRAGFLEGLLHQKLVHIEVEEKSLFASGDSRLWHCIVTPDSEEGFDIYGKYLRNDTVDKQVGLLSALSSAGINCPVVIFASQDKHFYMYRAVRGVPLVEQFGQLSAEEIVEQVTALVNRVHYCQGSRVYLQPIILDQLRHKLEDQMIIAKQLLPESQTKLEQYYQDVTRHLDSLVGETPTHGDLNPWNIIIYRNQLGIIDFSEASLSVPELDYGILLGSLDFVAATNDSLQDKALEVRNSLVKKLRLPTIDQDIIRVAYYLAVFRHLWVISTYGIEIEKGKQLAQKLFREIYL
ncbi:MAG: phosphotransferase [Patescibacteria group bacterium]